MRSLEWTLARAADGVSRADAPTLAGLEVCGLPGLRRGFSGWSWPDSKTGLGWTPPAPSQPGLRPVLLV